MCTFKPREAFPQQRNSHKLFLKSGDYFLAVLLSFENVVDFFNLWQLQPANQQWNY